MSKIETISEEMRILYVALTRAKEKLIITGTKNDITKYETKLLESLNTYNINENVQDINHILLKKYNSYLDWINLIVLKNKSQNLITKYFVSRNEIIINDENLNKEFENEEIDFNIKLSDEEMKKIEDIFKFAYKYEILENIPSKTTVSKIKEENNENIEFDENKNMSGIANVVPNFIENEVGNVAAKKGTLMHLVLQKIEFGREYKKEDLEELLEELVARKIILEEDKTLINLKKILMFTKSNLYKIISNSKIIEKEKAFCMKLNLDEYKDLNEDNKNEFNQESVLVQGIIDLYAIDNDDKIILVDYKTDFVEEGNEKVLVNRYSKQLELYKKCLEDGLNLKVKDIYIYSLYLNKEIML